MVFSSGASSGSEEGREMERKRRRRMQSNRESARRSRLRKQKHLDDLTEQAAGLRKKNNEMVAKMKVAANLWVNLEAENSILRAQMAELTHRLQSLNDILIFISSTTTAVFQTTTHQVTENFNGFEDQDYYCGKYWT